MCQLSQKKNAERMVFHHILGKCQEFSIRQSCQSCILGIRYPTVPRDPMGGPWVEASACESLRSIIVATCRTCPFDLGWRERCVDVSYCQELTYWYNFLKQASFALKLSSQLSTSVHRCEVFNGWRGKSRSVELEGRDLVSTEECTAKDFPAIFALMIRSMECSHSNNPSNTVMQRLCIGA